MLVSIVGFVLAIFAAYRALLVLGPERTLGDSYRIFFFHTPAAIISFLGFTFTLIFSILYLAKRNVVYDYVSSSSAKLGLVFITSALFMGSIWSKLAWGAYWNWDPRQTTVLILWFVYAAYFALRSAIEEFEAKARSSAILAIFGYVAVPLSYLSTRIWYSLHPVVIRTSGIQLEPNMIQVFVTMIVALTLIFGSLLWIDVQIKKLESRIQEVV